MAKRGTLHHPKLYALSEATGLGRAHCIGILESLWHFTSAYHPTGDLTGVQPRIVCQYVGEDIDPDTLWAALIETGWLDHIDGSVCVHDWHDHADDATKKRLQRAQGDNGGQRRTTADNGGQNPPRAWPLPEPKPEPKPAPAPEPPARTREKPPPDPPPPPQFSSRVPQDLEARLVETGVSPEQLADVIAAPDGVQIIELQLEWLPLRGSVANPAGMLVAACRGAARGDPRWTTAPAKARARAAQEARATQAAARLTRLQASQEAQRLTPIQRRLDALPEPLREEWRAMVRRASPWLGGLLAAAAPDPHPDRLVVLTLSRTACQALTGHRDEIERLAGRPVSVTVIDTAAEEAA